MARQSAAPIVLMTFDRPHYFEQVLQSLVAQQGIDLGRRDVWLFQDGGINPYTGITRGAQHAIDANIRLFKQHFPDGMVFDAGHNLGVALNFDRAERYVFEEAGRSACVFLEDDMVLSENYIRVLDQLLALALDDSRIGYVAAYGDHKKTLAQQSAAPNRLITLRQNWAFGLTRTQWLRNRPFVERYLELVRGVDYRLRDSRRIYDLYSSWGMDRVESSQDRAKLIACCLTGGLRINTTACFARYIGRVGLHAREDKFVQSGFDDTVIYPDGDMMFEPVSDDTYRRLITEQRSNVVAPTPVLEPGTPLLFGTDGNGLKALRRSFYRPEAWGSWSAALKSEVSIRLAPGAREAGTVLRMRARHHLPPGTEDALVGVHCNGIPAGEIRIGRGHTNVSFSLPANAVKPDGALGLRFDSPIVGSPAEFKTGTDARKLTIGLGALELEPR